MQDRPSFSLPNAWIPVESYYLFILSDYWTAGLRFTLHLAFILLWSDNTELVQLWLHTAMLTVMGIHGECWETFITTQGKLYRRILYPD